MLVVGDQAEAAKGASRSPVAAASLSSRGRKMAPRRLGFALTSTDSCRLDPSRAIDPLWFLRLGKPLLMRPADFIYCAHQANKPSLLCATRHPPDSSQSRGKCQLS